MQVDKDQVSDGNPDFYNQTFRYTLEAHIPYFKSLKSTQKVTVDPHAAIVYNQDLFGYLLSLKILPCYHWLIMRLNDYYSPTEFNLNAISISIPNTAELESLRQSWRATTVIKT